MASQKEREKEHGGERRRGSRLSWRSGGEKVRNSKWQIASQKRFVMLAEQNVVM